MHCSLQHFSTNTHMASRTCNYQHQLSQPSMCPHTRNFVAIWMSDREQQHHIFKPLCKGGVWMSCLTQRSPQPLSLADPPRKNSSHLDVRPAGAERSREGAPDGRRWRRRRRRRRRLPLFHYCAPCYRTAKLWKGVKKRLYPSWYGAEVEISCHRALRYV